MQSSIFLDIFLVCYPMPSVLCLFVSFIVKDTETKLSLVTLHFTLVQKVKNRAYKTHAFIKRAGLCRDSVSYFI